MELPILIPIVVGPCVLILFIVLCILWNRGCCKVRKEIDSDVENNENNEIPSPKQQSANANKELPEKTDIAKVHIKDEVNNERKQSTRNAIDNDNDFKECQEIYTKVTSTILGYQESLRGSKQPERQGMVRDSQNLLLILSNLGILSTFEKEDAHLIIGVDATPRTQAGYCVNLRKKTLQFYIIKGDDLPWLLRNQNNPTEFEMKNLVFALTVWKEDILNCQRIRLHTDNFAVSNQNEKYGSRAAQLLKHFTKCEGIVVTNEDSVAVNRFKDFKSFVKYIQAADDLSRYHIKEAINFLRDLYGIPKGNISGTHEISSYTNTRRPWYNPKSSYQQLLNKVNPTIMQFQCSNLACSRLLTASLRVKDVNRQQLRWA